MKFLITLFLCFSVLGTSAHASVEAIGSTDSCLKEGPQSEALQVNVPSNPKEEKDSKPESHHCSLSHITFYFSIKQSDLISVFMNRVVIDFESFHRKSPYLAGLFRPPRI